MSRYRTRSWRGFEPDATSARVSTAATVRILGIDPGSRRTGFGLIESRGNQLVALAHGCLNVAGAAPTARLRLIFEGLQRLLSEHAPAEVAVERVFVNRNVDSALKLGQARGAALCAVPPGRAGVRVRAARHQAGGGGLRGGGEIPGGAHDPCAAGPQ